MQYVQPIELDVANCNLYKCIYAKQGDAKSRYIKATILVNGEKVTVSSDMRAMFRAVKPDGTSIYNSAVVNEDGTITAELTQQTLAVEGTVDADILIMSSDGEELSTAPFKIDVEMSPCGDKIDSDNEFLELIQMIRRGEEVIKKAEDAAGKIGDLSALQTDAKDTLVAAINEAAASGGADWAQNDTTAKDYVKNRPGGYDIVTPEKVISEYQLQGNVIDVPIELSEPLVVGRSYRFTFYETADQSNTIFDGEVVAVKAFMSTSDHDDAIAVIAPGCGYIIHPVTYPEKPALYRGYEDSEKYAYGHLKLVALAHTETVKIPNKYIINSDFIITATMESPETGTLDKTFDQIQEAIRNGKRTVVHIPTPGPESENGFSSLQLLVNDSEMILFSGTASDFSGGMVTAMTITISKENKVRFIQCFAPTITPDGTIRQLKMSAAPTEDMQIATKKYVDDKEFILQSTTPGSVKKFKITVDDSGTITTKEV